MKIRAGIVDDHRIVIDGLKALISSHDDIEIVFECTDPRCVVDRLKDTPIDVLITDMMMPEMDGMELSKKISAEFPGVRVMVLSMNTDAYLVNFMIEQENIHGYLAKNIGTDELVTAIRKVAAGGSYFGEEILEKVICWKNEQSQKPVDDTMKLTNREMDIVRLMERELTNREIANELFISERTVETHRKNIFRKTGAKTVLGVLKTVGSARN